MAYNAGMPDAPPPAPDTPRRSVLARAATRCDEAVTCERCGQAEMYRMHAVWRCPACGFKTDCCGW
jgi:ribosomal protein L37AE/L43A